VHKSEQGRKRRSLCPSLPSAQLRQQARMLHLQSGLVSCALRTGCRVGAQISFQSLRALPENADVLTDEAGSLLGSDDAPSAFPQALSFTVLAALAICISYADRSNLSTAIIPMSAQYSWDGLLSGVILSAFFVGYATTQVVAGLLADYWGGEGLLLAGLLLWSLCTGLTPLCAEQGDAVLIANRVLLGAGEGLALPAVHSMLPQYVPPAQRASAAAVVTAACYAGALASNLASPPLIAAYGWPATFYLFALLPPLLWLPLWSRFLAAQRKGDGDGGSGSGSSGSISGSSGSSGSGSSSDKSRRGDAKYAEADVQASVMQLLQLRPVQAIVIAQYCQSWGMYGLLSWLPTYYSDRFDVPLGNLGTLTALPYLLQTAVAAGAGFLADDLVVSLCLSEPLFYVLCSMFYVLCSTFSVLCSLFYVLCSLFYVLPPKLASACWDLLFTAPHMRVANLPFISSASVSASASASALSSAICQYPLFLPVTHQMKLPPSALPYTLYPIPFTVYRIR
jgi:MFS family permease